MARPAFPKVRRLKQPLDELPVGIWRFIVNEGGDLARCWRQAGQIEAEPANQRVTVGWRRRGEVMFFQLCQKETVDGIGGPFLIADRRGLCGLDGLPSPVRALAGFEVESPRLGAWNRLLFRPGRARLDPLAERGDLFLRKTPRRRHQQRLAAQEFHQAAVFGLAWLDGGPRIAAL